MGLAARERDWNAIRQQALERDSWRCLDCGRAGALEVHHVRHLKDGGNSELQNLKTLCIDCHIIAHRPMLSPAQVEWAKSVQELL